MSFFGNPFWVSLDNSLRSYSGSLYKIPSENTCSCPRTPSEVFQESSYEKNIRNSSGNMLGSSSIISIREYFSGAPPGITLGVPSGVCPGVWRRMPSGVCPGIISWIALGIFQNCYSCTSKKKKFLQFFWHFLRESRWSGNFQEFFGKTFQEFVSKTPFFSFDFSSEVPTESFPKIVWRLPP